MISKPKPRPKLKGGFDRQHDGLDSLRTLINAGTEKGAAARLLAKPSPKRRPNASPKEKPAARRLYALDTETTGLDFWHGCRPFFVSWMDEDGNLGHCEWDVNPLTRTVGRYVQQPKGKLLYPPELLEDSPYGKKTFLKALPQGDFDALSKMLQENDFVLHNTRFDCRALEVSGFPRLNLCNVHDTLIASHCLVSNEPHGLKDLAIRYLDINDDDQKALRDATNDARRIARSLGWAIASDGGHPHFPGQKSAPKDGWWVYDTWLPRAVARWKWQAEGDKEYVPEHPWWTVLQTYALRDVERTYPLWWMQQEALKEEGLWDVYLERRKLLASTYEMESHGVTLSMSRLQNMAKQLRTESDAMSSKCLKLAKAASPGIKELNLNSPKQLTGIMFGDMGIRPTKLTSAGLKAVKSGEKASVNCYSTNAESLNVILERLHESYPKPYLSPKKRQAAYDFIWNLLGYRAREKSLDYLGEYNVRSVSGQSASAGVPQPPANSRNLSKRPRKGKGTLDPLQTNDFVRIFPSFNPTGSDTLRFSSSNPNAQNIGKGNKRKDDPVPSLRSIFGPAPGREWYSIDYSNIELRIFAYQSGDKSLIDAYEQGFAVHCIFAELLWEKEYKQCREECRKKLKLGTLDNSRELRSATEKLFKDRYESTLYQWVKNGNFALIYGAGEARADSTYHRPGAYDLIRRRLPLIDDFMSSKNQEAKRYGFITTLGGYRLCVPASEPHVAVNYFVQGSAGWCMVLAINRVHSYLQQLNASHSLGTRQQSEASLVGGGNAGYQMIMTIHDELDFDFPIHERNTEVISKIARLMEQSGDDIDVPTPVEVERHLENWSQGEKVKLLAI